MAPLSWSHWLRSLFHRQGRKANKPFRRPSLERLEDRLAPATFIWTGLGANTNWSTKNNWINSSTNQAQAPSGNPATLDDLVFDGRTTVRSTVNDITYNGGQAVFDSITIDASNYSLSGKPLTLGSSSVYGSGFVNVGQNDTGDSLAMSIQLGGPAGSNQFFNVDSGGQLTITGKLSGTTGSSLTKGLAGNLTLTADNSGFTGPVNLTDNGGTLTITNANALGNASTPTTVGNNSQLQVNNVTGAINQPLILNGPGPANDGALLNLAGNNTWAGAIQLDTKTTPTVTIGSTAGALSISGQISDLGSGANLIKEGAGQIIFSHIGGNTYRGTTAINNGILTIQDPLSLGEPLSPPTGATPGASNGTTVNQSLTGVGTLQLNFAGDSSIVPGDPNGILQNPSLPHDSVTNPYVGFQVRDEWLTLNGHGSGFIGALENLNGNNNWAGPVALGSAPPVGQDQYIGVASTGTLIISGVISNPNGFYYLYKVGPGELIFNNANKYYGDTYIENGTLDIRDSKGLGTSNVTVFSSGTLALEVDTGFDAHGRNLGIDSVTGQNGNGPQLGLTVSNNLTLYGSGAGGLGALHSISGINIWTGPILIVSAAIGVDADLNASNTAIYFTHDYSLTVTGNISGDNLTKVDSGQLILPKANSYTGTTTIKQGWITIQDSRALGPIAPYGGSDTIQPATTVMAGAALHFKPLVAGTSFDFVKPLILSGNGITHPFALINQKGALMNLGGANIVGGPVFTHRSDIQLKGVAGIGVEVLSPDTSSQLTITSSMSDFFGTAGGIDKFGSQVLILQGDGTYSGDNTVSEGVLRLENNTALGTATSGTVSGTETYTTTTTTVAPGISEVQTVTISGNTSGTFTLGFFSDSTPALPANVTPAALQAALSAFSTVTNSNGSVTVNQAGNVYSIVFGGGLAGVNLPQLTATPSTGTLVTVTTIMNGDGASLELGNNLANAANSNEQAGLTIWNEHLVLNSLGNAAAGDGALTVLTNDNLWQGPVTLTTTAVMDVLPSSRLTIFGGIGDSINGSGPGPGLVLKGGGELILAGSGTYHGNTSVQQGVLVVANSQALGSPASPEVQTLTLSANSGTFQLEFEGQITGFIDASSKTLANDVQTELNKLSTIGGVGGSVTVSGSGTVLTVDFGGSLGGFNQPVLFVPATTTGGLTVNPAILVVGSGGVDVVSGASIELQGSVTVAGKPLILRGVGASTINNVPLGWLPVGPSPINNGQTPGNQAVSGRVTGVVVDPTDTKVIYLATAGSGVWKTKDDGLSWQPLFDLQTGTSEVQKLTVSGMTGTYTLSFVDPLGNPPATTTTTTLNYNATAAQVESALNALSNIGGETASVTVTQTGLAEVQQVTVTGGAGTFTLSFNNSESTPPLPYNLSADQLAAALNALSTIGGVHGLVAVTGSGGVFTITFGGTLGISQQPLLTYTASGGANVTVTEVTAGAAIYTITFGGNYSAVNVNQLTVGPGATAAVSISTVADGIAANAAMFVGTITMDPTNDRTLYVGTGETNNSYDSFYGTGIYKSTDAGYNWTLVGSPTDNPFVGKGISRIIVDPNDPSTLFVTDGDGGPGTTTGLIVNGTEGQSSPPATAPGSAVGVWRYLNNQWANLTSYVSVNRATTTSSQAEPAAWNGALSVDGDAPTYRPDPWPNPPNSPGPDDNYLVSFPQQDATWSDVALIYTDISNTGNGSPAPVIYAALGTAYSPDLQTLLDNGVFWCENPYDPDPSKVLWYLGDPGGSPFSNPAKQPQAGSADTRDAGQFPVGSFTVPYQTTAGTPPIPPMPQIGNIKIAAVAGPTLVTSTVYASVEYPTYVSPGPTPPPPGYLNNIYVTHTGGQKWAAVPTKPPDYMNSQGGYANAIYIVDANTIYVGGYETNSASHTDSVLVTRDGGTTWTDLSIDSANNGPHTAVHAITRDAQGRLLVATDGGVWRLELNGKWSDLNGDLTISQINGVASNPTDPTQAFAGTQSNGIDQLTNNLAWQAVDGNGGGQVRIDPNNPNNVYGIQLYQAGIAAVVRRSTNGGASWTTVINTGAQTAPLVLDTVNTSRLLVGGSGLYESTNQGSNWTYLNPLISVSAVAIASYQGPFVADGSFPDVTDLGANTYDPGTIYVTNGSSIYLTKDRGQRWVYRTPFGTGNEIFSALTVDPTNRDTVYAVSSAFQSDKVFKSTNAGRSWSNLTYNLPDMPVWTVAYDPRTGNLYIGNDEGVYELQAGSTNWVRFGSGMPNVQVHDLELNMITNTLLAGTYGRGVYELFLDDGAANAGALRAVSGTSIWAGPVLLVGDPSTNQVVVSANGINTLQNGIVNAQLNIQGTISDEFIGANPRLVKIGQGNVIFSGANLYGGTTEVKAGALIVHNPDALGQVLSNQIDTLTITGASGVVGSDLFTLTFTDPSGNAQTTGQIDAASATLATDIKNDLTNLTNVGPAGGTVTVNQNGNVYTVTFGGTLGGVTLAPLVADTVSGTVKVFVGLVNNGGGNTIVDTGTALELQSDLEQEPVTLYGNGILFNNHYTGALRNVSSNNTYTGTLTMATNTTIGVDSGTSLTIGPKATLQGPGTITDNGANLQLTKELTGTLILTNANTYGGLTEINQGAIQVQHPLALGGTTNGTDVLDGGQLQLQTPTTGALAGQPVVVTGEALTLSGTGINGTGALLDVGGNNTWAGTITLDSKPVLLIPSGTPATTPPTTIAIGTANASDNLTLSGVITQSGGTFGLNKVLPGRVTLTQHNLYGGLTTVVAGALRIQNPFALGSTTQGTVVNNGAALELDGDPTGVGNNFTVSNESLTINGPGLANGAGSPPATTGALRNVSGNNIWNGIIYLQNSTNPALDSASIGADAGTELTVGITGTVRDAAVAAPLLGPVPAASLLKVGDGTVLFQNPNSYSGKTFVNDGVLDISNAQALGNSAPEQETVTVGGANGTFTLTFNNQTTISLDIHDPNLAADMQSALNALPSIGGVGGTVIVTQGTGTNSNVYTVNFGGTLSYGNLPQMTSTLTPGVSATVATLRDGPEGTTVNSGGTLRLEGGFIVSTEWLTLNGTGFNNKGALENLSGANTWTGSPTIPVTLGSSSTIGVDGNSGLTINQVIGDSGQAYGVTKVGTGTLQYGGSFDNTYTGLTAVNDGWLLLDKVPQSEVQQLVVEGQTGTYTLTFNGQTTATPLNYNDSGATVQAALQSLIPAFPNSVSVVQGTGALSNVYTITFTNLLANADQPPITGVGSGGTTLAFNTVYNGNPTPLAITGNLTVGDGTGASPDTAQLLNGNQIADTSTVTVNSDGKFDLNDQTDTINALVVNDGNVTTGPGTGPQSGKLTTGSLTMTGGTVSAQATGSQVVLAGVNLTSDVTATSDASGSATINGSGTLSLGGTTRTFTVNAGTKANDLVISAVISGTGSEGLTKNGTGLLELNATNTYTGLTTIQTGNVQVDGKIGDVSLTGGKLSGNGTAPLGQVGQIGGPPPGTAATGTVSPGDGSGNAGILNSSTTLWGANTTFTVNLSDPNPTGVNNPTPGTNYDQLNVTGSITLGGIVGGIDIGKANLNGLVSGTIGVGHQFTIITATGGVIGNFIQGTTAFVGGNKFTIDSTTNPDQVVLTKILATASVGVSTTKSITQYGQDFTITATVTPETGAGAIPLTDTLTFKLKQGTNTVVQQTLNVDANGQAVFDPQTVLAGLSKSALSLGTYDLEVDFTDNATLFNNVTITQSGFEQVQQSSTTLSLASFSPVYGQAAAMTAVLTPAYTQVANALGPTGTVSFKVDGNLVDASESVSNYQATSSLISNLTIGTHSFAMSYTGDTLYTNSNLSSNFTVTKDNSSVSVTATPSTISYSQDVTLSVTVTPAAANSTGKPTGSVVFWDGAALTGTKLGSAPIDTNGKASLTLSSSSTPAATILQASGTAHTITVSYGGDIHYNSGSGTTPLTVNADDTTTAVTATDNTPADSQVVTFTATVSNNVTGGPVPVGNVTFTIDSGTPSGPVTLNSSGQATYQQSFTGPGTTHTVLVNFLGSTNFNASNGSLSPKLTVLAPSQISIGSSLNPAPYNQAVTFTATVIPGTGFTGNPSGTVSFTLDGNPVTNTVTYTSGSGTLTAAVSISDPALLTVGTHTIGATYNGDTNFHSSTATALSQQVYGTTTTTLSPPPSPNPSTYGDAVTFTATVSSVGGTPTDGTVTFWEGPANTGINLGQGTYQGTVSGNGEWTLQLSTLSGGSHTINASYNGDASGNFQASSTTTAVTQTVKAIGTTTTISAQSTSLVYGQTDKFTATVTSTAGPAAGSVTFVIDGTPQTSSVLLDGSGKASVTLSLSGGSHTIGVNYNGTASFAAGSAAIAAQVSVSPVATTTTIASSLTPSTYGESVTFTATVNSSAGTPDGSATFVVDGVNQVPAVALNGSGQATLVLSNLSTGQHTIGVNYAGDASFAASSPPNPATQFVNAAPTTTALTSSLNPAVFGQSVTFTATVTAATITPSGSVTFSIDGISQATVALNGSGQATFTPSVLPPGQHNFTASFAANGNFLGSQSAALSELATVGSTTVTVSASPVPALSGQPVTFTATVTVTGTNTPVTSGTVTLTIDGVPQPPVAVNANGQASITLGSLTPGNHTITATYSGSAGIASSSAAQGTNIEIFAFRGSPNDVWISQVYSDLLHRTPDAAGMAFWDAQLESGVPRITVAQQVLNSTEYRTDLIVGYFSTLLGTTPSAADVQYQLNLLNSGETDKQVEAGFLSSPAFIQRVMGGDPGVYTNAVYQYVLGFPANQGGITYWSNFLLTNSRYDMALQILQSPQRDSNFVEAQFQKLLGRPADNPQDAWFTALQNGARDEDVIAGIISSDEYYMRLAPAHDTQPQEQAWVKQLYNDFLGRAVDTSGLNFWVNLLEHGTPRLQITEQITNSVEYHNRVIANMFQTLLNRPASANDVSVFENYLQQGGTLEGMKAMIIGSAEYYFGHGGSNFGFLSGAYKDILEQQLDNGGIAYWGTKLAAGEDRTALATELLNTVDAKDVVVQQDYQLLLQRATDAAGMAYWANQLQMGFSEEYVQAELAATIEYFNRAGHS